MACYSENANDKRHPTLQVCKRLLHTSAPYAPGSAPHDMACDSLDETE